MKFGTELVNIIIEDLPSFTLEIHGGASHGRSDEFGGDL
jgi:hypothetical protein